MFRWNRILPLLSFAVLSLSCNALPADSAPQKAPAVDLNRASVTELMQVRGMTASWAGRIVRFRPYWSKLDLTQLGVVPPDVYQRIRDGIVVHHIRGGAQNGRDTP